jgi:phosphoribosylformylglycinamidine synthase subunit PurQ / glutaminase
LRFGIVVFPGTNCDGDTFDALDRVFGQSVEYIWHGSTGLPEVDCLVLPGGFSYGDYLRAGAIARFSPVMSQVTQFAQSGGLVLGICNGFQVLCEAGLLPGALLQNDCLEFRCGWSHVRVERTDTPFTAQAHSGQVLRMPIAHGEGRYFADPTTLARLRDGGQVILRYCSEDGTVGRDNPNGSLDSIAGICNERRNVFGLMPHPERCSELVLGGTDGATIFRSALQSFRSAEPVLVGRTSI